MLVPATVPCPIRPGARVSAVLFDLDGTLYDQRRMRAFMAAELLMLPVTRPLDARRVWRGLSAYRRAQESLRRQGWSGSAARAQLERAASATGLAADVIASMVEEWMIERPLKYLRVCRAPHLTQLLDFLRTSGVPIGLLSDYPAAAKLRALEISERFSLVLCSTDPDINAFKPDPRGFLEAARRWQVPPAEILVVGDRAEVDGAGAVAAGMPSVIVGRPRGRDVSSAGVLHLDSLERLHRALAGHR